MDSAETRAKDVLHTARSGTVQLLSVLAQGLSTLQTVVVNRAFGPGIWGIYSSTLGLLEPWFRAARMSADSSMHRFLPPHRAAGEAQLEQRAFGTALRLALAASFAAAVVVGLFPGFVSAFNFKGDPAAAAFLPLLAPALVTAPGIVVLIAATLARKVSRMHLYVRGIAEPVLLLGATATFYLLVGPSLAVLGAAYVVASLTTYVLAWWACIRVFGGRWIATALRSPRHEGVRTFALPIAATEVMAGFLQRMDVILLPNFVSLREVGFYTAGEFLARLSANARYAFDGTAGPMLAEALHLHQRERLKHNLVLLTRWVALLAVPMVITLICLRREILTVVYGEAWVVTAGAFVVQAVGHFINSQLGFMSTLLTMSGRTKLIFVNQALGLALNVVLMFVLTPRFGLLGAATAALVGISVPLLICAVQVWAFERVHPFSRTSVKPLVAGALAGLAQTAIANLPLSAASRLGLGIIAGLVVYLVAIERLGLHAEERQVAARILQRLKSR